MCNILSVCLSVQLIMVMAIVAKELELKAVLSSVLCLTR